jgi:hypothetical protein
MIPHEGVVRRLTLSGRRLAAALVFALTVGFVSGWLAHRPPPPADTAELLRAFEQVNQHAAKVITDAMRAGGGGTEPGTGR